MCVSTIACSNLDRGRDMVDQSSDNVLSNDVFDAQSCSKAEYEEGVAFANMLRQHAYAQKSVNDEINALHVLFMLHYNNGNNQMALNAIQRAIHLNDSCAVPFLRARSYHYMGKVLIRFNNHTLATKNLAMALSVFFRLSDTLNITAVSRDFAHTYNKNNILDSAMSNIRRAIFLDSLVGSQFSMVEDLALLGECSLFDFRSDLTNPRLPLLYKAKSSFDLALGINGSLPHPNHNVLEYTTLGYALVYYYMARFCNLPEPERSNCIDSAICYHRLAYKFVNNLEASDIRTKYDILGLNLRILSDNEDEVRRYSDSIIAIGERSGASYLDISIALRVRALLCERARDYAKALHFKERSDLYNDAYMAQNSSTALTANVAKIQHDGEVNRARSVQSQMESEAKVLVYRLLFLSVLALLLLVVSFLVIRNLRRQRRLNGEINEINAKLALANRDVSERNREITDSLNYARIIQSAAMPSEAQVKEIFGNSLIFLRARDIVSGDFYWAAQIGGYKLLALGDCTGHGVPGALLSMLGMSILDYITRNLGEDEVSAGLVLDNMRTYFKRTLNQNSFSLGKALDSIDLALLVVDPERRRLHYAGAFRPLLYFRGGEYFRIKADPMPIGVYPKEREHFTNHVLDLCRGDVFYLFSDGVTDQSGYHNSSEPAHVYSFKRFQGLLQEIHTLHFAQQKRLIRDNLRIWRTPKSDVQMRCEQTDDVSVLGIAADNFIGSWD